MKRILCTIVTMLALTANLVAQNTAIYKSQGGDSMTVGSGGTLTVASGGSLVLASGSTLTDTATASHAGVHTFTGNVYFGAAGYKSTNTASSGAWAFPATLIVGGAVTASSSLDVTGNSYFGAAGYRSTNTASSGAWAMPATLSVGGAFTGTTSGSFGTTLAVTGNVQFGTPGGAYVSTFTAASGNIAAGGAVSATTSISAGTTITAGTNITANAGAITVSSATTSENSMCFKGAYVTLPTTGAAEGCLAYQTSDHALYVATKTITAAEDWKVVW